MRKAFSLAMLGTIAASLTAASLLQAGPTGGGSGLEPITVQLSASQVEVLWKRNWPSYARCCAIFEEEIVMCPTYDQRMPSSLGKTPRHLTQESRRTVKYKDGMLIRKAVVTMHRDEAEAVARTLPSLNLGAYGYVHSVYVDDITGPDEMIIKDIWLVDPDKLRDEIAQDKRLLTARKFSYERIDHEIEVKYGERQRLADMQKEREWRDKVRLKGILTKGIKEKARWEGPKGGLQIAIVKLDPPANKYTKTRQLVATPASLFDKGINEDQFISFIESVGYSKAHFCATIAGELQRDRDPEAARLRVFAMLENAHRELKEKQREEEEKRKEEERKKNRKHTGY